MKTFTGIPTSQQDKKQCIFILSIFLICSLAIAKAESVNDALQKQDCNTEQGFNISIQLFTFAQKMYNCNFQDIESIVSFDYTNQVGILNALDKSTAFEIQSSLQSTSQKLSLEYGFVGLPEYFFYTKLAQLNPSCGDVDVLRRLGDSYNDCKLCMGNSFSTKDTQQINLLKSNQNLSYNDSDNIFTLESSAPLNAIIVQSFQLLWNCNNPNDQLIVTGYFDDSTEKRLLDTDISGFEKVCMKCQVSNCGVCTSNYAQCLQCKEGFYMQNGLCIACSQSDCAICTKNTSDSSTTCNLCRAGFYLLNGQCVETCPPEYKTTKTQCLICRPGTYIKDETCAECSPYCQECTGPNPAQCSTCFDGFVFEYTKGCSLCPTGQQCGKNRCTSNQYRMLQYPYTCGDCFQNCETCQGPNQNDCLTCKNNYNNVNGFCLNPSFKAKTFIDPRTKTEKECNFSCDECIDSTDLCTKCNTELNYFLREGDRFKCYNRCPLYYQVKQIKQNSTDGYVECIRSDSYTSELQMADDLRNEAKNRCPKSQFWDIETKQCFKCTNNCISCNDNSSCIECEPAYYWNNKRNTCSPCHSSCKKCTGPLYKDCLACPTANKLFPDVNGICDATMSTSLPETNILTQNQIYENLQVCRAFLPSSQQQNYAASFKNIYSSNDSDWANIEIMNSSKPCTFTEFKNRYRYLSKNNLSCNDKDISQSTVSKKGDLVTIYAILLAQSGALLTGQPVNPKTLVDYSLRNDLFSSSYFYNPTLNFNCNQLQCNSQLDSFIQGLTSSNPNKVISIKKIKDITLTTTKLTPLNCFQDEQLVNENTVHEIEQVVNNAQLTLNTTSKNYFVLYICGKDVQDQPIQRTLLVQKYLGNAFFEVLNVNNPTSQQVEKITLYGATAEQNTYLKKCDPSLSNSLSSYLVQKVRVIQVQESDRNADQGQQLFQQYNDLANIQPINPAKCSCSETKDYILSNENQGSQFITVITSQNKLLTQSINAYDLKPILKNHNLDADDMKTNNLSITKIEAESIFKEYITQIVDITKKCYGIVDSTPLCMVNILADIVFSSRQNCINSKEISVFVQKVDFNGLKDFLGKSNWCTLKNERCLQALQILKACI